MTSTTFSHADANKLIEMIDAVQLSAIQQGMDVTSPRATREMSRESTRLMGEAFAAVHAWVFSRVDREELERPE